MATKNHREQHDQNLDPARSRLAYPVAYTRAHGFTTSIQAAQERIIPVSEAKVQLEETQEGALRIALTGPINRDSVPMLRQTKLTPSLSEGASVTLDLRHISEIDSAGVAYISLLHKEILEHNCDLHTLSPSADVAESLDLLRLPVVQEAAEPTPPGLLESLGTRTHAIYQTGFRFSVLAADSIGFAIRQDQRTRRVRKDSFWFEAQRIGLDSLPIVGLISLLVGLVVALQSAYQLRQFGANIYVANLIGVSMTREMGPLMTAIILAGRSGAAIAAEIATMVVSEEVAALKTMGLNPTRYIVAPKFRAITMTMPALSIFATAIGIFGGYLIALLYLGLGTEVFFKQVIKALVLKDLVTGVIKSIAFAWIIVLVSSHYGFNAHGGAESVGRVTTQSVVASIFWVIVADAAFSLIFYFG